MLLRKKRPEPKSGPSPNGTQAEIGPGPDGTQAQTGPGPNGTQAQMGPGPKRDPGPNGQGPNVTMAQNLSVAGFPGKIWSREQNRHGRINVFQFLTILADFP